jgi:hypothetical protein
VGEIVIYLEVVGGELVKANEDHFKKLCFHQLGDGCCRESGKERRPTGQ